jgi:hypothetical protein
MKVRATHYKGIEFVTFQELPADQQLLLRHNAQLERINILIDGKVCRDCIQYSDYNTWYASVFLKSVPVQKQLTGGVKLSEVAVEA